MMTVFPPTCPYVPAGAARIAGSESRCGRSVIVSVLTRAASDDPKTRDECAFSASNDIPSAALIS